MAKTLNMSVGAYESETEVHVHKNIMSEILFPTVGNMRLVRGMRGGVDGRTRELVVRESDLKFGPFHTYGLGVPPFPCHLMEKEL